MVRILSINENESECLEKLAKLNLKDEFILSRTVCSFYFEQFKVYFEQLKEILSNKIKIYQKQLNLPVFLEENVRNFNELGLEVINNLATYL